MLFTQTFPSKTLTCTSLSGRNPNSNRLIAISTATDRATTTVPSPSQRRRTMSALEARISLVAALASQASSVSQRLLLELATETAKYVFPKQFEARTLEEALMSVPDLETVKFKVLSRRDQYEIREVEPYFIAETTMPGKTGFDFNGASHSFNVLAEYLFGKNTTKEKMEMTTPVFTRKAQSDGVKMEMTTPVITTRLEDQDKWKMSFVIPSKITEVPRKIVAAVAFSGFVTDEEVKQRESKLREALKKDGQFQVKEGTSVEVAQYNPPFTLPFQRRNEISLEVESKEQ
ncbi:heme-binding-like protein [Prunus yedoensis var. nudiflora]|uniref:Heme-binding-like protein n=1 Tax=Prunus yedoensis var. nudiflora TaxID=2094558 RepID=A0A314XYR4_PRUYE|nr:heme-binding-like protein [Prunus yedoensis var. nudiflora]